LVGVLLHSPITSFRFGSTIDDRRSMAVSVGLLGCCRVTGTVRDDRGGGGRLLAPLFRTSIGFDRLALLMDTAASNSDASSYPPYNVQKTGEDTY
jgi:hypothetical protein